MSKAPGTSGSMPVTGAACGIKPSQEAMEVEFEIDFSQAKQFLSPLEVPNTQNPDKDTCTQATNE